MRVTSLLLIILLFIGMLMYLLSWEEVQMTDVEEFLVSDDTDKHCYIPVIYDCKHFAGQVVLRARALGLNIRPCLIFFDWNRWHVTAWFKANGKIYYINCMNDRITGEQPEGHYWDLSEFPKIRF